MPKIVIAGFQHETNTFSPLKADLSDFIDGGGWPSMTLGQDVINLFKPLNIPIGGFICAAESEAELVPVIWTNAEPCGPVTREAFDFVSGKIVDTLENSEAIDGIYLDLHGAMVTQDHDDGEAALLRRIRDTVGSTMPIAVSLDFHANISPELAAVCDCLTIYRTYPHLDMDATGGRAWPMLKRMILTGEKPAMAFRQVDTLVPLSAQCTEFGPLSDLYQEVNQEVPDITSKDIAMGFPAADIPDAGISVVVVGDDTQKVNLEADRLAARSLEIAPKLDNQLEPPAEAVCNAMALTADAGMVVLADVQDNSGAGAMSDSTGLLAALIQQRAEQAVLGAFYDPQAVKQARNTGEGAYLTLELGANHGPDGVSPLQVRVRVERLTDGRFRCTGSMQRDVETDIGPSALLAIQDAGKDLHVLVSSRRHQAIDQQLFRHVGIEPAEKRIVAVKSTVHYRADFAPLAKAVIRVEAPGYNPCILSRVSYKNLRPGVSIVGG